MTSLIEKVKARLCAMPDPKLDYYAVTILASSDGKIEYSVQSHWVGFTDETPPREIREASLQRGDGIVITLRALGETAMIVDTPAEMGLFFAFGGNAVVEQNLARSAIPNWVSARAVVNDGKAGFVAVASVPVGFLSRAPTPKHRMKILQRDNYRCRVCGRSPRDYVDIELHIHHIRPWSLGGITDDPNLITLCHTCHTGLDPHFEASLFDLLPQLRGPTRRAKYWNSLRRYQELTQKVFHESDH